MQTEQPILILSVLATTAITKHRFVDFNGATAAANANALGVADLNQDINGQASVKARGVMLVEAGAAVAKGAQVGSDAQGRAVTYTTGRVQGEAMDAATAAGQLIRILR